jgi:AcrR family transcriptional regulator
MLLPSHWYEHDNCQHTQADARFTTKTHSSGRLCMTSRKAKLHDKLLNEATGLFARHGFHAVGIRDITQSAGVSYQSVYNHFSDKAEIAREVLERHHHGVIAALTDRVARAEDGEARLKAIFDWHGAWFKHPDFMGCLFDRALKDYGVDDPAVSEVVIQHKQALRRLVAGILRGGLPSRRAQALALDIVMLLDGATTVAHAFRDPSAARRAWHAAQILVTHARGDED